MSDTYVIELTREEAVALVLLARSRSSYSGFVHEHIGNIGDALAEADDTLEEDQFEKFKDLDYPEYDLGDPGTDDGDNEIERDLDFS